MAKIVEFDVSGVDPEDATAGQDIEDPAPGVYQAQVREINPGYSKGDDGKPDKSRPRLEVIYSIIGDAEGEEEPLEEKGFNGNNCRGARIWDYVSFSEAAEWKLDQFLQSIGESTHKKRKGKFDAEKHQEETIVRMRVKADKNLEGNYRAKVGGTWAWEDLADDEISDEDLDELEDDEWDEEEFEDDDLPTVEEIRDLDVEGLKTASKEHGISLKGLKGIEAAQDKIIEELGLEEDWDDDEVPF